MYYGSMELRLLLIFTSEIYHGPQIDPAYPSCPIIIALPSKYDDPFNKNAPFVLRIAFNKNI